MIARPRPVTVMVFARRSPISSRRSIRPAVSSASNRRTTEEPSSTRELARSFWRIGTGARARWISGSHSASVRPNGCRRRSTARRHWRPARAIRLAKPSRRCCGVFDIGDPTRWPANIWYTIYYRQGSWRVVCRVTPGRDRAIRSSGGHRRKRWGLASGSRSPARTSSRTGSSRWHTARYSASSGS